MKVKKPSWDSGSVFQIKKKVSNQNGKTCSLNCGVAFRNIYSTVNDSSCCISDIISSCISRLRLFLVFDELASKFCVVDDETYVIDNCR